MFQPNRAIQAAGARLAPVAGDLLGRCITTAYTSKLNWPVQQAGIRVNTRCRQIANPGIPGLRTSGYIRQLVRQADIGNPELIAVGKVHHKTVSIRIQCLQPACDKQAV